MQKKQIIILIFETRSEAIKLNVVVGRNKKVVIILHPYVKDKDTTSITHFLPSKGDKNSGMDIRKVEK